MKLPETKNDETQLVPANDSSNNLPNNSSMNYNSLEFIENLFSHTMLVKLLVSESNTHPYLTNSENNSKRRFAICLTKYEETKVNEILNAVDAFVDEKKLPLVRQTNDIYESFNSTILYTRMIIQFCKRVNSFNDLSPANQFALLKPAWSVYLDFDLFIQIKCLLVVKKE